MGRSSTFTVLIGILVGACLTAPAVALATSAGDCSGGKTAEVDTPEEAMAARGINASNPCPESPRDSWNRDCKNLAKDLKKAGDKWLAAHKSCCSLIDKTPAAVSSNTSQEALKAKTDQAKACAKKELAAIDSYVKILNGIKNFIADELASNDKLLEDAASGDQSKKAGAEGRLKAKADEIQKGQRFFGGFQPGQVAQVGQRATGKDLQQSEVSGLQGAMVKEPMQMAEVSQHLERVGSPGTELEFAL